MRVKLEKAAEKYLEHMSEPMKSRMFSALEGLEKEPPLGDIKRLQGKMVIIGFALAAIA
ncbi:hypothetical protein AGMMS50229_14700 [Campylobacterota bacterium]|nr:hypothetical protein AGMMS50229_14700 [Campylobacterota bacterium]